MKALQTRVISLPHAPMQRKQAVTEWLDNTGLDWSFFDAVDGKKLTEYPEGYHKDKRLAMLGYHLTLNEVACFLSHQALWQESVDTNQPFLILEDDAILSPSVARADAIHHLIHRLIDLVPEDQLFVRLAGGEGVYPFKERAFLDTEHHLVRYKKDKLCSIAYIVSPSVAKKLLQGSQCFFVAVDNFMWRGWEHGCELLDVMPYPLAAPDEAINPSTIGARAKPQLSLLLKIKREFWRTVDRWNQRRYEYRTFIGKH